MTKQPPAAIRGQSGFSLIEVLVAVVVLAVGVVGLAGLQFASLRYNHSALVRSQATTLAYEIADAMRSNCVRPPVPCDADAYLVAFGASIAGTGAAQQDLARWLTRVAEALPSGQGEIALAPGGSNYEVRIRWDDTRGAEAPQQFSFTVRP